MGQLIALENILSCLICLVSFLLSLGFEVWGFVFVYVCLALP